MRLLARLEPHHRECCLIGITGVGIGDLCLRLCSCASVISTMPLKPIL